MYKRNSKILAALLTIVLVFSILPSLRVNADDSGTCGDNLTWTYVDSTKTLTISGTGAMTEYMIECTPWYYLKDSIETVIIEGGVTSFGNCTFYNCSNLTNITIPSSVTSIGSAAFMMCTSLDNVVIPTGITTIKSQTFEHCTSLTNIQIPNTVTNIGLCAFMGCTNLTSITIPNSVTSIGYNAFRDCPSDFKINYSNITYNAGENGSVNGYATGDAPNTVVLTVTPNTGYVVNTVTVTDSTGTTTINPDSSGNYSFPLPSGDATVDATFMPGGNCGKNGDNVKWTYDDSTKTLTISGSGAMADYAINSDVPWQNYRNSITSVVINNGVTSIGKYAFYAFTSLPSITIPDSVTSIGDHSFYYCTNLTSVTIPNSVTSIGDNSFVNCYSLTSITIPDSVTSIGRCAFLCAGLTNITIPDSVIQIEKYAFQGCTSLTSITIPSSVTSIDDDAFFGCDTLKDTDNSISIDKALYDSNKDAFPDIPLTSFNFTKYAITYTSDGNGSVTGVDESASTDKITLTITTNANYVIDTITYTDNGTEKTINKDANDNYTFDMPSGDTTVNATFKPTYEIQFVNTDGTVLQSSSVPYGDTPVCTITPTQAADAQYTYTFSGWTPTIAPVAGDTTYTATYSTTTNEYTVTFTDADGNQLQSGKVAYGTVPAYSGTPTKAETDKYTYTFAGWKSGNSTYGVSSTLPKVTGDVTYTAVFTETAKPTTTPAPVSKPGTYYLSSMTEQDGNIVITIKMSEDDTKTFDLLGSVTSDGVPLTEGNQYTAAKGSAIITINKSFLDTLAAGNHKLTVTFTDGGSITIDYEVKAPAAAPQAAAQAVQATGEATCAVSIAGVCLILAAAGIAITVTRKRKETEG